jgi:hypothetical protein
MRGAGTRSRTPCGIQRSLQLAFVSVAANYVIPLRNSPFCTEVRVAVCGAAETHGLANSKRAPSEASATLGRSVSRLSCSDKIT